jgi:hypothetical protein
MLLCLCALVASAWAQSDVVPRAEASVSRPSSYLAGRLDSDDQRARRQVL